MDKMDRPCKDLLVLQQDVKAERRITEERFGNIQHSIQNTLKALETLASELTAMKEELSKMSASMGRFEERQQVVVTKLDTLCKDTSNMNGRVRALELSDAKNEAREDVEISNKDNFLSALSLIISILTAISLVVGGFILKLFGK